MKISFIGAGNMALAIARGLPKEKYSVSASAPTEASRERFSKETGGSTSHSNTQVVLESDVVILCVKPPNIAGVCNEICESLTDRQLVVSVAAGIPLKNLELALGEDRRIVRVMPNTPCLIREGASAYASNGKVTETDLQTVEELLSCVGKVVAVTEAQIDAVTGLSGSGPAYVFQIVEALSDGGVLEGLPRATATMLAAQTVMGAARLVIESGKHPGELKDMVTSPGGTTIAALRVLESGGLRGTLMDAVSAATTKARDLGSA